MKEKVGDGIPIRISMREVVREVAVMLLKG